MKLNYIAIILTLYLFQNEAEAYNILGVFPLLFRSHNIFFEALMKGLAERGHQVDVISHYELKDSPKNYRRVLNLKAVDFPHPIKVLTPDNEVLFRIEDTVQVAMSEYGNRVCEMLAKEKIKNFINNPPKDRNYDLIITEGLGLSCFYVLGHIFNVSLATVTPSLELPWIDRNIGNPLSTAFHPTFTVPKSEIKTFWDRLRNTVQSHIDMNRFLIFTGTNQTEQLQTYFGKDVPSVRELEKRVSLSLVNTHYTLQGIRPTIPALVEVGGLHIEEDNSKLTKELQDWMDESKNGVVYISLGTSIPMEMLPKKTIFTIYASLAKLQPIRVLLKTSDEPDREIPLGLPKNVMAKSWIPQIPVLRHNNTKLFVTHGGALSIQEAMYFGVPMIGFPIFYDQHQNVAILAKKNICIQLDYKEISEQLLDDALRKILTDPKYREAAKHHSSLFRDRPMSAMDTAAYWIEYIIRNGPKSLRSPATDMHWWQVELLDVYGFLLICSLIILYGISRIVKSTSKILLKKRSKSNVKRD